MRLVKREHLGPLRPVRSFVHYRPRGVDSALCATYIAYIPLEELKATPGYVALAARVEVVKEVDVHPDDYGMPAADLLAMDKYKSPGS